MAQNLPEANVKLKTAPSSFVLVTRYARAKVVLKNDVTLTIPSGPCSTRPLVLLLAREVLRAKGVAYRLKRLLDHWAGLVQRGVWAVGPHGVEGELDVFRHTTVDSMDYVIPPSW
ncbi:hypothetical protein B0T24DRAFT_596697 [Lasiosphaeria ovina]|uniref:Uncharacterized protein n=1 Tax=Lasiosphaeria ovina TaxID=92902 RepID=A0AAE0JZD2_9PEZI|nr:hypothetical protein B0T24DRAFT_596697 [Lasiosphaeria ovina]